MPTFQPGPNPSGQYEAVTPSDTVGFTNGIARALYIGVAGNVAVVKDDRTSVVVFQNVSVGVLPVICSRVNATGTTASGIVALF